MQIMPDVFWSMTFAEFDAMADGYVKNMREQMNQILFLAWRTATWYRSEKIPQWDDVRIRDDKPLNSPKVQSVDEMLAACKLIVVAHGGQVIEV